MNSQELVSQARWRPVIAGIFIVLGVIAGVLSVVPVLEAPGYLGMLADRRRELLSGAFFQALMVPTCAGFALVLHPMLREVDEGLAVGFVGFRLVACGFHLLAALLLPLIVTMEGGGGDGVALMMETLRVGRDLVNHVGVVGAIAIADTLFFVLLWRSRWVPRWLSLWGGAAGLAVGAATLGVLLQQAAIVSPLYLALTVPLGLQNLVLAGWLTTRGFNVGVGRRPYVGTVEQG